MTRLEEMKALATEEAIKLKERENFIVSIKHNPDSGNFFIDFNTEEKYIVSVKVSETVAECIARDLGLKIMI